MPLRRQVRLGAATNQGHLFDSGEPKYQQTFLANFDSMTPEFELKIAQLQPTQGQFEFTNADRLVDFAEANGKQLRGHTLIWGNSLPAGSPGRSWTREELIEVLETYVSTVVGHFRGRIPEWDVVNEAIDDKARCAAPVDGHDRARVCGAGLPGGPPRGPVRQALLQRLQRGAAQREVRRHLQTWPSRSRSRESPSMASACRRTSRRTTTRPRPALESVIARLEGSGLESELTEVTVNMANVSGLTDEEKLALQTEIYQGMVAACQAHLGCTRVTTWGVTDKYTSMGSASVPLLLDTQYEPKPALGVVRSVLGR